MPPDAEDKNSRPIEKGDDVWTRIRGGKHEGQVDDVVTTEQEAKDAGVKRPPKVREASGTRYVLRKCLRVIGTV